VRGPRGREPLNLLAGNLRHAIRRLRFRWNASAYYEPWLISQIPRHARHALDIGCGAGRIARLLADRGLEVDAIDRDSSMLDAARSGPPSTVRWIQGDLLDTPWLLRDHSYDAVVVVGTLHFMDSQRALARLRHCVAPNGILLVIGLFRAKGMLDTLITMCVLPVHVVRGWWRSHWDEAFASPDPNMPLAVPRESLAAFRQVAMTELPGCVVRRRLFWRYTLLWRKEGRIGMD